MPQYKAVEDAEHHWHIIEEGNGSQREVEVLE